MLGPRGGEAVVEIVGEAVLRNFPLRVWQRQQEYTHDLLREFQLLTSSRGDGPHKPPAHAVPAKLLALADEFVTKYGSYSTRIVKEREAALRRGEVTIDSSVPLPAETPDLVASVRDLLVEVDEYCRRGDLPTLTTPPDVAALREWTLSEMLRQYDRQPPTPWSGRLD
jgi:hypothetical protein